MKKTHLHEPVTNMKGSALIFVVVIIMVLTSLGLYGLTSTSVGLLAAGTDSKDMEYFNNAMSGLKFAIANFDAIYDNTDNNGGFLYCTIASNNGPYPLLTMGANGIIQVLSSPCTAIGGGNFTALGQMNPPGWVPSSGYAAFEYALPSVVNGAPVGAPVPVAKIEIVPFTLNPVNNPVISAAGNNVIPEMHLSAPPPGYSNDVVTGFKSRNYCITSTALTPGGLPLSIIVQSGVVKAIQKSTVDFLVGF